MKKSPFMQRFEELPNSLPIFPLSNAVLMPGSLLPLNIFEPRYVKMVQDAMQGNQLIGMIQPIDTESPPNLHKVGCVGRITQYEESNDGRLGVLLTGLCRFKITEELSRISQYRIVAPDWADFEDDYETNTTPSSQIALLFNSALRNYLNTSNVELDWSALENLSVGDIANGLLGYLPLASEDKQLLIETDTLENRLIAFIAILSGDKAGPDGSDIRH